MRFRQTITTIILWVCCLAVGFGGGWYGAYQKHVAAPERAARELAQQQQAELDRMVRRGKAVAVKPDALTVEVKEGGGDLGKTITVRANEYTAVQIAMNFVNQPGEKTDLSKWFRAGDQVDLMVKEGQILAVHRESRPGEQPPLPANKTDLPNEES